MTLLERLHRLSDDFLRDGDPQTAAVLLVVADTAAAGEIDRLGVHVLKFARRERDRILALTATN